MRTLATKVYNKVSKVFKKEEGASLVEYGLLVALIAVICIGAVALLGSKISGVFNSAATQITVGS